MEIVHELFCHGIEATTRTLGAVPAVAVQCDPASTSTVLEIAMTIDPQVRF